MNSEKKTYTGNVQYKEIGFTFVFADEELKLIPPEDKRHVIEWEWGMKQLGGGAYTFADPIPVGIPYLIGVCNETKQKMVFVPQPNSYLHLHNSIILIDLLSYVVYMYDRNKIDRLSFTCSEIDYIHPVNQAFSISLEHDDFSQHGIATLNTREFDVTTTNAQLFNVDGKEIHSCFGVSRFFSTRIGESPLSLKSSLMFEFEPTDDYIFILRLWRIARSYIQFLCYRRNIFLQNIELSAPYENGKHEKFATMYIVGQNGETENDALKSGRYIKQVYVSEREGAILSDIAENCIYMRHLPETYQSGRHIDAARFVMITAAFEWEFRRLYPNGVKKSDATIAAEEEVSKEMDTLIENNHGKKKNIYKFLKRLVKSDSLQSEIIQIGKDFDSIIGEFGRKLYHINSQELQYSEMGLRLSDQRNHFAHGDIDKDFIGLSLLDLIYMEYLIYAMQLKYYNIDNDNIEKSINELFHLNIAI